MVLMNDVKKGKKTLEGNNDPGPGDTYRAGRGRYEVWMRKHKVGDDLIYVLGGGERPHVGGVVVRRPGEEAEVVKLEGHRDHEVLEPIARAACERYGRTVVAVGGIHIDDASKDEIDIIVANCKELMKCI